MTAACHLYGWKAKVFLTLWRIISNPGVLVPMYLILGISYFNTAFIYILWQRNKDNCQGDGPQELRLNL